MRNLQFLLILLLPLLFASCKDEPAECETFANIKGEIQFWQEAGRTERFLVQAENNTVFPGMIVFKLNKPYDEISWLINNDSNYTYTSKEVSLRFIQPYRTYSVLAIATKYFDSKECGKVSIIDTISSSFTTKRIGDAIGMFAKEYEIESTDYPGEKWSFFFRSLPGPVNDFQRGIPSDGDLAQTYDNRNDLDFPPPYLTAVNFPRFENDSFIVRSIYTDGYSYFDANISFWDTVSFWPPPFRTASSVYIRLKRNPNTNEVNGEYSYVKYDFVANTQTIKKQTFIGKAK